MTSFLLSVGFLLNEHEQKTDEQQCAGKPDGIQPEALQKNAPKPGAEGKQQNNTKVSQRFAQIFRIFRAEIGTKRVHAAADIADAHGAGKAVSVHLAESLHLHGAGKGNQRIRRKIVRFGHETNKKQQPDFAQQHPLPPMDAPVFLKKIPHTLRRRYAQRKREQRNQIVDGVLAVAFKHAVAEQNDIAGLRVCEYTAPRKIGVSVLQAAGKRQKSSRQKGVRHLLLPVFFEKLSHVLPSDALFFGAKSGILFLAKRFAAADSVAIPPQSVKGKSIPLAVAVLFYMQCILFGKIFVKEKGLAPDERENICRVFERLDFVVTMCQERGG